MFNVNKSISGVTCNKCITIAHHHNHFQFDKMSTIFNLCQHHRPPPIANQSATKIGNKNCTNVWADRHIEQKKKKYWRKPPNRHRIILYIIFFDFQPFFFVFPFIYCTRTTNSAYSERECRCVTTGWQNKSILKFSALQSQFIRSNAVCEERDRASKKKASHWI